MKKSRAGGRHKWKWHKKTERAVFSLFAIANTKARGEALIEATEWHAQSNWISSAVSSNLIWPALWMDDRRAKHILLPAPPSGCAPHTEGPTDVPLPYNWPTSAVWAATADCLDCPIAAPLLACTPRRPLLHCLHTFCAPLCYHRPPRRPLPFSHLSHLELGPPDTPRSEGLC